MLLAVFGSESGDCDCVTGTEDVISFKKNSVVFFISMLEVRNPRWRPKWPPHSNYVIYRPVYGLHIA